MPRVVRKPIETTWKKLEWTVSIQELVVAGTT